MAAAAATDSPVIIQASRGARAYANDIVLAKLIDALIELYPDIPVCMHQDHGNSEATCFTAIQYGFSSVMMDGSLEADAKTPSSYEYNVAITAKVVEVAHAVVLRLRGSSAYWARSNTVRRTGRWTWRRRQAQPRSALDRPRSGRRFRDADKGRCASDCDGYLARRL